MKSTLDFIYNSNDNTFQVSWDVVDQLRETLDVYETLQNKCMMYLLSAKELFRDNLIFVSLESKFSDLIKKSTDFVLKHLSGKLQTKSVSNDAGRTLSVTQQIQKSSLSVGFPENRNSLNVLDDDMNLSSEEWNKIDRLSIPRSGTNMTPAIVFNRMESQSKTLSIMTGKSPCSLKTPGGDSVFRVQLDAEIPKFDLGVDDTTLRRSVVVELTEKPTREKKNCGCFEVSFSSKDHTY